jgi:hypothetical protein
MQRLISSEQAAPAAFFDPGFIRALWPELIVSHRKISENSANIAITTAK